MEDFGCYADMHFQNATDELLMKLLHEDGLPADYPLSDSLSPGIYMPSSNEFDMFNDNSSISTQRTSDFTPTMCNAFLCLVMY